MRRGTQRGLPGPCDHRTPGSTDLATDATGIKTDTQRLHRTDHTSEKDRPEDTARPEASVTMPGQAIHTCTHTTHARTLLTLPCPPPPTKMTLEKGKGEKGENDEFAIFIPE